MGRSLLPSSLFPDTISRGKICVLCRRVVEDPVHVPGDAEGRAVERGAVRAYQQQYRTRPFSGLEPLSDSELAALAQDKSVLSSVRRFERTAKALAAAEEAQLAGGRPPKRARTAEEAAPGAAAAAVPIRLAPEVRCFNADVPAEFFCRLFWAVMADPVFDCEGNTWERAAITAYVQEHGASPLTGTPMHPDGLLPNISVREDLESWLAANTTPWAAPRDAPGAGQGFNAGASPPAAAPHMAAGGAPSAEPSARGSPPAGTGAQTAAAAQVSNAPGTAPSGGGGDGDAAAAGDGDPIGAGAPHAGQAASVAAAGPVPELGVAAVSTAGAAGGSARAAGSKPPSPKQPPPPPTRTASGGHKALDTDTAGGGTVAGGSAKRLREGATAAGGQPNARRAAPPEPRGSSATGSSTAMAAAADVLAGLARAAADPAPAPPEPALVKSWTALVAALRRLQQEGEAGCVVDLCGTVLASPARAAPSLLRLVSPRVVLRNGTLRLAAGWRLVVEAEGALLQDLVVEGRGAPQPPKAKQAAATREMAAAAEALKAGEEQPLVEVTGPTSSAQLERCRVAGQAQNTGAGAAGGSSGGTSGHAAKVWRRPCVAVLGGARVELDECQLSGAQHGLLSSGEGSVATARSTTAARCTWGFGSRSSSHMTVEAGCSATENGRFGFVSAGHAMMSVAGGCTSERNSGGFLAISGGKLDIGSGCIAKGSTLFNGFMATGAGSRLTTGAECCSDNNCGSGFFAQEGGEVRIGPGCVAEENGEEGFCAAGGRLAVASGCCARGNGSDGFWACIEQGSDVPGVLDASAGGCTAEGNKGSGFSSGGSGCKLVAGPGCRAAGNQGAAGYEVLDGATLAVHPGCQATGNSGWGLYAGGEGSVLQLAAGCEEATAAGGNTKGALEQDGGARVEALG